jgi:prepilin-type N-terminal cleavage/methylation domain-containing protein
MNHLQKEKGFTVFELLVVLVLSTIFAATALQQYADMSASFNRQNGLRQLESDLRRARAEVVAAGARGVFTIASDGKSYSFGLDYIPFSEDDPPESDSQMFRRVLPTDISLGVTNLLYDSKGFLVDADDLTPTTQSMSLRFEGSEYCAVEISSIGMVTISCP